MKNHCRSNQLSYVLKTREQHNSSKQESLCLKANSPKTMCFSRPLFLCEGFPQRIPRQRTRPRRRRRCGESSRKPRLSVSALWVVFIFSWVFLGCLVFFLAFSGVFQHFLKFVGIFWSVLRLVGLLIFGRGCLIWQTRYFMSYSTTWGWQGQLLKACWWGSWGFQGFTYSLSHVLFCWKGILTWLSSCDRGFARCPKTDETWLSGLSKRPTRKPLERTFL